MGQNRLVHLLRWECLVEQMSFDLRTLLEGVKVNLNTMHMCLGRVSQSYLDCNTCFHFVVVCKKKAQG